MSEQTSASPSYFARAIARLSHPRTLATIALSLSFGVVGALIGRQLYIKPQRDVAFIRYQSHLGLMRLYDLQLAYRRNHDAYANDLNTLLMSAPDGTRLRVQLEKSVDLNTLAVIGDANRFRLEANVLDPERTSVKLRGPLGTR